MTDLSHKKVAFVFPGQGSQFLGMGKGVYEASSLVRDVFDNAGNALGFDIADICFNGPVERLNTTQYTQPAILTVSVAILKHLLSETDLMPVLLAGHSLGEYTALVAANVISFKDAVKMVYKRGLYMQEAVPIGMGGMAAIIGIDRDMVEELCKEASRGESIVVPANYNSPGQIVVSGHSDAVDRVVEIARNKGCKRAIKLSVSVPSHSPLMEEAATRLAHDLEEVTFSQPEVPIVTNLSAEPVSSASQLKEHLIKQLTSPVRWDESMVRMGDSGVQVFIEIGPGRVLKGLLKRILPDVEVYNIEDIGGIKEIKAILS